MKISIKDILDADLTKNVFVPTEIKHDPKNFKERLTKSFPAEMSLDEIHGFKQFCLEERSLEIKKANHARLWSNIYPQEMYMSSELEIQMYSKVLDMLQPKFLNKNS